MVKIASDKRGTHSLQTIISLVNREKEDELIKNAFEKHIFELSFVKFEIIIFIYNDQNENGTHLVQKLIKSVSIKNIDFIYKPLISNFLQVANHPMGLCVVFY